MPWNLVFLRLGRLVFAYLSIVCLVVIAHGQVPKEEKETIPPKINQDYWKKFENNTVSETNFSWKNHPLAIALLKDASTPYDVITVKAALRPLTIWKVEPVPIFFKVPAPEKLILKLKILNSELIFIENQGVGGGAIKGIDFFEERIARQTRAFIEGQTTSTTKMPDNGLTLLEVFLISEHTIENVMRFHESARATGGRSGKDWDSVKGVLQKIHQEIRLGKVGVFITQKEWDKAGGELEQFFANGPTRETMAGLGKILGDLIDGANQTGHSPGRVRELQGLVLAWERKLFPGFDGPVTSNLNNRAEKLFHEAEKRIIGGNEIHAKEFLIRSLELNPRSEGARNLLNRLVPEQSLLKIAVRQLPSRLDPCPMLTETESAAADLVYESLFSQKIEINGWAGEVKELAKAMRIEGDGCKVFLSRGSFFSNGLPVTSGDVVQSWNYWRGGMGETGEFIPDRDPLTVFVRKTRGSWSFSSPNEFKVTQKIEEKGSDISRVGTGPYQYSGRGMELGKQYISFLAQPYYSFREGKTGKPWIREVRFYQCNNPLEEVLLGKMDFALGLTAQEAKVSREAPLHLDRTSKNGLNRRVYFLAVNSSKGILAKAEGRKAVAHSIRRETILNSLGFGASEGFAGWALGDLLPLQSANTAKQDTGWDVDLAAAFHRQAIGLEVEKKIALRLKYPGNDQRYEIAAEMLCAQISSTLGIDVKKEEVPQKEYWEKVVMTGDYDLAFGWHDFVGRISPVGLLGLWNQGKMELGHGPLLELEEKARAMEEQPDNAGYRIAREEFLKTAKNSMPFIPLWQTENFWAWRKGVHPLILDPNHLFSQIDQWRIDP